MNQNLRVNKTKLRTRTRFETEAKCNSEITYYLTFRAMALPQSKISIGIHKIVVLPVN